jgi:hypothetical protein
VFNSGRKRGQGHAQHFGLDAIAGWPAGLICGKGELGAGSAGHGVAPQGRRGQ